MHLLMSGMSGSKGGKETYIVGITRELIKLGDKVDFLTVDRPMAYEDEMESLGCGVYHIPKRNTSPIGHRRAISRVLDSARYDVLWSHKTSLSSIDDLVIAKRYGIGIRIIHSHCTENMGGRFTALMHAINRKRVAGTATSFYACSQRAGEYFYPPNIEFQVVKNAFDVDKFAFSGEARKEVRKELGIGEDALVLCHVGRFSPEKNHPKILNVFAKVHAKHGNAVLVLCGEGPTRQAAENLTAELGMKENVLFLGAVDNIPSILSSSDVFVFPSYHEGLPYALLEAQANGLPCIVSSNIDSNSLRNRNCLIRDLKDKDSTWAEDCISASSARMKQDENNDLAKELKIESEGKRIHEELCKTISLQSRNSN